MGDYKVHDEWRLLEKGMVLTIEPGIYISPDNTEVAKRWRGIGIRIEDDVPDHGQGARCAEQWSTENDRRNRSTHGHVTGLISCYISRQTGS